MKNSATQPKMADQKVYKSKEELFAYKREQKKRTLVGVDPNQLAAIRNK